MESHTSSSELPYGVVKLYQELETLVNNPQDSNVQFKVGGGIYTQTNGDTVDKDSTVVTIYAHSSILRCRSRYFAAMFNEENNWKESLGGVIYKPNISPNTFQNVLHYIYTGSLRAKTPKDIMELIVAADEMELEELSVGCQKNLIRIVKYVFSDENGSSTEQTTPIDIAIYTLDFANSHFLSQLSQELLGIIISNMSVIINSSDTYNSFVNKISSQALIKIIASDDLELVERDIWDLVLSWACHQTKLSKTDIETYLSNFYDSEENDAELSSEENGAELSSEENGAELSSEENGAELSNEVIINDTQFGQLKRVLTPFLPAIRFSLLHPEEYKRIVSILMEILPKRRFLEITQFFANPNTQPLNTPRKWIKFSKIVVESVMWDFLRKNIFETGGITGCPSSSHLKFKLLFRASEHKFDASTFHQLCDDKGPTLVIIKSEHGNIFGGVNFNHWKSNSTASSSGLNFLFALPDGFNRKEFAIFKIKKSEVDNSAYNSMHFGPCFGNNDNNDDDDDDDDDDDEGDIAIASFANTENVSFSTFPCSYDGHGESNIDLAGSRNFLVSEYEVFAIYRL